MPPSLALFEVVIPVKSTLLIKLSLKTKKKVENMEIKGTFKS